MCLRTGLRVSAECGSRMFRPRKPEERRILVCPKCGVTVDRDVNAAKNVLARGLRFKPIGLPVEAMESVCNPSVDGNQLVKLKPHEPTN